ncbi:Protein-L-isoaspartate O-methyltransferase [bioreactor metagenome]|uniref:Protein-L-isoaspartate O-methyltransferase n=1 Tax=bioreactor metagenome TaxID=1076179 RepID=A0A644UZ30_9ZZZZ|nr:O-methyltransferase [Negativicutes bacterium]
MSTVDSLLNEMEEYARINKVPIITGEGAKLLIETVNLHQPKSILEIGTAIGYSTILIGANSPDAKIITIEIDEDRAIKANSFLVQAGISNRVEIMVGDAAQVIPQITTKFDMVFIDAAKGQYLNYLVKTIDKLVDNAMVFTDNVLFRGMVEGENVTPRRYRTLVNRLREFLDYINHDTRFKTTIHRIGDGIAISIYQGANRR